MMILLYLLILFFFLYLSISKKKTFFKYFLFNKKGYLELKRTILNYGYNYKFTTHLFIVLFLFIGFGLICIAFEVRLESYLMFVFILIFWLPHLIIWIVFHSYQEKLFNEFTLFLQTFIAVFKVNPKTYPALCDCEKVVHGELLILIEKMKEELMKDGSIEDCMKILTNYQSHFIVHNLVSMIITIENHGGNYGEGLDLIQDDIDDWIEDTYHFKKQQITTKNKMMGLCGMSLLIAYIAKNMLSEIPFTTQNDFYQISIFFFISCLLFTIIMAHRIFQKSWFEKEEQL